jgi:hypothetical protein
MKYTQLLATAALAAMAASAAAQAPLGTAFTYQGQLKMAGQPVTGTADIQMSLWNAAVGGAQIGTTVTVTDVDVLNGLFTVAPNFGPTAINGEARWLEIAVRSPSGSGGYTTLSPRQELTAAPHALYAIAGDTAKTADTVDGIHASISAMPGRLLPLDTSSKLPNTALYTGHGAGLDADHLDGQHGSFYQDATNLAAGTLPGARLAGPYANALTFSNLTNSFTGNGAGLTALNAANLASGILPDARLSSNVALLGGAQTFSGTKTFQMPASFTAPLPFTVTTTANITNLNADLHDGYHAGTATGQVPVSTGALCATLNADLLDGYHAGNGSGQIPISNGSVATNLIADRVDGNHVAVSSVYTASGTQYIVNTSWVKLYATGVANVLRLENPAGSGNSLRYYYSIDFAAPVLGNLAAGTTVDLINLNNTTVDVRIYSGGGWMTYMGCSGGNGWFRGHAIYTD